MQDCAIIELVNNSVKINLSIDEVCFVCIHAKEIPPKVDP